MDNEPHREITKERWVRFLYISILFSPIIPIFTLCILGVVSLFFVKRWRLGILEKMFLGFVVVSLLSWSINPFLFYGFPVALIPIILFSLYALLSMWMKELRWSWKDYQKLYYTFWLAGLYPATVALLQRFDLLVKGKSVFFYILGFYPMQSETVRSIGTSFNSNLAAAMFICLALLSVYAASLVNSVRGKMGTLLIFMYYCVAMWSTGSRGAWVGLVIGLLIQVWMTGKRKRTVALFLSIVAIGLFIATNKTLIPREETLWATADIRIFVWQNSFEIFRENWLVGVLPLHFSALIEAATGKYLFHAHNVFLGIATEYGVIGLLLFLGMIVVTTARARRWRKTAKDRKEKRLAGVLISMIFALLGHGMYDYPIIMPQIGLIFMTSLIVIHIQYERRFLKLKRGSNW